MFNRIDFLCLAFILILIAPAWGNSCHQAALGRSCQALIDLDGAQSLPEAEGLAGNPIHTLTGAKLHTDVDLYAHSRWHGLGFYRFYQSHLVESSSLGHQWRHHFDYQLSALPDGQYRLRLPDDRRMTLNGTPSKQGHIRRASKALIWVRPDGQHYHFEQQRLVQISERPQQPPIYLHYTDAHPDALLQRVSAGTQQLHFHYDDRQLLTQIDSPWGPVRFEYDPDQRRLMRVLYPDQRQLMYHYEQHKHPFSLTGVSIQASESSAPHRLRYWAYDPQGRAVYSAQQNHENWVSVSYPTEAGQPIRVHSAAGAQEQFFNDHGKLVAVTGAPCPGCPPVGYQSLSDDQFSVAAPQTPASSQPSNTNQVHTAQYVHSTRHDNSLELALPHHPWQGLTLRYDAQTQQLQQWRTALTGVTTLTHQGKQTFTLGYANGDEHHVQYSAQGRVQSLEQRNAQQRLHTRLHWASTHQLQLDHPNEQLQLRYTPDGKLSRWHSQRDGAVFTDRFHYNDQQKIQRIQLYEGGSLQYTWQGNTVQQIRWHPAGSAQSHLLLQGTDTGYAHFNGSQMHVQYQDGLAHRVMLTQGEQLLYSNERLYTEQQRLRAEITHRPPLSSELSATTEPVTSASVNPSFSVHHRPDTITVPSALRQDYGYNAQHQLVVAKRSDQPQPTYFAWQPDGRLAAHNHITPPTIIRDASGLPQRLETEQQHFTLHYGPGRQVEQVWEVDSKQLLAQYRYNALGQMLRAEYQHEHRHFYYIGHQLQFERRTTPDGTVLEERRYVYANELAIAMLSYRPHQAPELYAIHNDFLGAPFMMTDNTGTVVWSAQIAPFGKAELLINTVDLPLRYPGQYEDPVLGWHHNWYRVYLPEYGHYLEPDPLGPHIHSSPLGYAQQRPRHYVDPMGLALFLFDGATYNMNAGDTGNIMILADIWPDQHEQHYVSGTGTPMYTESSVASSTPPQKQSFSQRLKNSLRVSAQIGAMVAAWPAYKDEPPPDPIGGAINAWDAMFGYTGRERVEKQMENLRSQIAQYQKQGKPLLQVDVLGYSRGAALARHFGNEFLKHTRNGFFSQSDHYGNRYDICLNARFMGLFDTVAQYGVEGYYNDIHYNFEISPAWTWVAHAVAMHDYRWLFPLSLLYPHNADNTIELGFIGTHNDIGGGVQADHTPNEAELATSRIPLQWMAWQAQAIGLQLAPLDDKYLTVPDQGTLNGHGGLWIGGKIKPDDRALENPPPSVTASKPLQPDHPTLGQALRDELEQFITRYPLPESFEDTTNSEAEYGIVDMVGYQAWIHQHYGTDNAPAQD